MCNFKFGEIGIAAISSNNEELKKKVKKVLTVEENNILLENNFIDNRNIAITEINNLS